MSAHVLLSLEPVVHELLEDPCVVVLCHGSQHMADVAHGRDIVGIADPAGAAAVICHGDDSSHLGILDFLHAREHAGKSGPAAEHHDFLHPFSPPSTSRWLLKQRYLSL